MMSINKIKLHTLFRFKMKKILIIFITGILFSQSHPYIDNFVSNHLLLTKSKMESSPTLWQDFREGYYRARTIRYSENLLDSIKSGTSSYQIAIKELPEVEVLMIEALSGKEFNYKVKRKKPASFNINYFSSSIE